MCNEKTKYLWYKYYGLFVRMYITSQQSYLTQINSRQTSFETYFDSKRKSRDSIAPKSVTMIYKKRNILLHWTTFSETLHSNQHSKDIEKRVAFIPKMLCCFAGHWWFYIYCSCAETSTGTFVRTGKCILPQGGCTATFAGIAVVAGIVITVDVTVDATNTAAGAVTTSSIMHM